MRSDDLARLISYRRIDRAAVLHKKAAVVAPLFHEWIFVVVEAEGLNYFALDEFSRLLLELCLVQHVQNFVNSARVRLVEHQFELRHQPLGALALLYVLNLEKPLFQLLKSPLRKLLAVGSRACACELSAKLTSHHLLD